MSGRAEKFYQDLHSYIDFRKECDGVILTPEEVDFEDFLGFLDVEHYLGLRGSDTWSEDGNEAQVVVKTLIGQILVESTPKKEEIPSLYLNFAKALQPGDHVITFNYDVLLERAMEAVRKPFRLFPTRFTRVTKSHAECEISDEEVVILKVHGSIDWFDRRRHRELEDHYFQQGLLSGPNHPVFSRTMELDAVPLLEGPRFDHDPLCEMWRVRNAEELYRTFPLFRATPWLLNPSSAKILYSSKLKDFWYGLGDAGILNFGLAIIGFSLSEHDRYTRQILYGLVKNYQTQYWGEEVLGGLKKTPLVLIDLRKTPEEKEAFKRRYAFVDLDKTICKLDGFNDTALSILFE